MWRITSTEQIKDTIDRKAKTSMTGVLHKILLAFVLACCAVCLAGNAEQPKTSGSFTHPAAVEEVLSGKRTVANAAWWGFEAKDSTDALQAAINSGASKIIVPYMGSEWIVRPIKLVSNQEIVFEPGVIVTAKKGEFKSTGDSLFKASAKHNITLRGYGATLRMQKQDYMGPNYKKGEWRMVLELGGCTNVKVLGLTLKDSGGDGIYLGETKINKYQPCKDVLIRDCVFDNNYRQGISVISTENLRIDNCVFKNTSGHSPASGIDLEPNFSRNKLKNIVISNCVSENNEGRGFVVGLTKLTDLSPDISILFVDCYVKGCGRGLEVLTDNSVGPKGLIEFRNCTVEDVLSAGIWIVTNVRSFDLRFTSCKIKNANSAKAFPEKKNIFSDKAYGFPVVLRARRQKPSEKGGEIRFDDCYVYDQKPRAAVYVRASYSGILNAKGVIYVQNKFADKLVSGPEAEHISFKVERLQP